VGSGSVMFDPLGRGGEGRGVGIGGSCAMGFGDGRP